ncbi:hypothetical protein, partial [Sutterella massiliensis]|uniref:hypothetical protein n=1 Tax=Sutterella massiliensis TaxID=1816689 RepID=UPI0019602C4C
ALDETTSDNHLFGPHLDSLCFKESAAYRVPKGQIALRIAVGTVEPRRSCQLRGKTKEMLLRDAVNA